MLGTRIRQLREARGISQPELARRVRIAQASLSLIESGKTRSLKASTLMRLAKELDADPEYIRTGRTPTVREGVGLREESVLQMFAEMDHETQDSWIEMGHVLLKRQGSARVMQQTAPKPDPSSHGDVTLELVAQLADILETHGPDSLARAIAYLQGAVAATATKVK